MTTTDTADTASDPGPTAPGHDASAARDDFARAVAAQVSVDDPALIEALSTVERHVLIPRAYVPCGTVQPNRRWRLVDGSVAAERSEYLAAVYGLDQVVIQLDGEDPGRPVPRTGEAWGVPTGMSSGAGLVARALTDLELAPGMTVLEVGGAPGYLAALTARLTGRTVTTVEADSRLADHTRHRLSTTDADVRVVTGDGLLGLPGGVCTDRIAVSVSVSSIPSAVLGHLAPGGVLRCSLTTGAPGWHATALVRRDQQGHLSGRLTGGGWAPIPARGLSSVPLPATGGDQSGAAAERTCAAPPGRAEHGFWLALAHLAPGVRRDWTAQEDRVVLVTPDDGSRAVLTRHADRWRAQESGPRRLWAEAEPHLAGWELAGRPADYQLRFDEDGAQCVDAGPHLTWTLPTSRIADPHTPQAQPRRSARRPVQLSPTTEEHLQ